MHHGIDYYEECLGSYDGKGCCLLCDEAEPGCLCYECKCTKCFWYEDIGGEGYCTLAESWKEENRKKANEYSNKKVRNPIKCDSKKVLAQIEDSDLIWIPLSVINSKGFVKNWFVNKKV